MSYHIGARALERLAGHTGGEFLPQAILHAIGGSLPASRFVLAGERLRRSPPSAVALEQQVRELWAFDLNPAAQLAGQLRSGAGLQMYWNAYNEGGNVGAPTRLSIDEGGGGRTALRPLGNSGVTVLMDTALTVVQVVSETVRRSVESRRNGRLRAGMLVSDLACALGRRGGVLHEASLFFEAHPGGSIDALARALGSQRRSLERRFRGEGLTPVALRRACALVGAARDLWSGRSLTVIAMDHGYADLAHMSRAISRATGGVSPQMLRRLAAM